CDDLGRDRLDPSRPQLGLPRRLHGRRLSLDDLRHDPSAGRHRPSPLEQYPAEPLSLGGPAPAIPLRARLMPHGPALPRYLAISSPTALRANPSPCGQPLNRGPATLSTSISCSSTNRTISAAASDSEVLLASITTCGLPSHLQRISVSNVPPPSTPWSTPVCPPETILSHRSPKAFPNRSALSSSRTQEEPQDKAEHR